MSAVHPYAIRNVNVCSPCISLSSRCFQIPQPSVMGKQRKPMISLAAAMHRVTPAAVMPASAASAAAAPSSSTAAAAATPAVAGGKKRKRGPLISAFHVLMREQDALASSKASLTAAAYAAKAAELQSKLDALGGLEAYQQLSIAGHQMQRKRCRGDC